MSLPIPTSRPNLNHRSSSAGTLRHTPIEHTDDLTPLTRSSRPSSESSLIPTIVHAHFRPASPPGIEIVPTPRAISTTYPSEEPSFGWNAEDIAFENAGTMTKLLIGSSRKKYEIKTTILAAASPFFAELLEDAETGVPLSFPDVEEFAFTIWLRYVNTGELGDLAGAGAEDFHALTHYLGVYCLARRWGMEGLGNRVVDLIRIYYAQHDLTAPPYRLEYVYGNTTSPNSMRAFLVATAAWRVAHTGLLSDSMRSVLAKGGDLAVDFIEALLLHARDRAIDARKEEKCEWHEHLSTMPCASPENVPESEDVDEASLEADTSLDDHPTVAQTDGAMDDRAAIRTALFASRTWSRPEHGGSIPRSSRMRPLAPQLDGPVTPFTSTNSLAQSDSASGSPTPNPQSPPAALQPVPPTPTLPAQQSETKTPSSLPSGPKNPSPKTSRPNNHSNPPSRYTPPKPTTSNPQTPARSRHPSDSPSPTVPSTPLPKLPLSKTCVCVLLGQPPCDNHIVRTTYCDCTAGDRHSTAALEARESFVREMGEEDRLSRKSVKSERMVVVGARGKEQVQWEGVQGFLFGVDGDVCAMGIAGVKGVVRRLGCGASK